LSPNCLAAAKAVKEENSDSDEDLVNFKVFPGSEDAKIDFESDADDDEEDHVTTPQKPIAKEINATEEEKKFAPPELSR
jgi:hypothetical protein